MKKLLVILGPTATSKTDLALQIAHKFQGELVSCDSRQVYRGLDIGTGKLPSGLTCEVIRRRPRRSGWEIDGMSKAPAGAVKIWMYDVAGLKKQYTVYDYVQDANKVVDEILKRGKLPIIVGGTGLYLKALLEGLPNLAIPVDKRLRKELEKLSLDELQKKLQKLSSQKWEKMNNSDRQNPRRLIRAIEISSIRTPPRSNFVTPRRRSEFNILKIGLIAPREILYKRIDDGVLAWIKNGIVDEVSNLMKKGVNRKRFMELGLEYTVAMEYLEKKISFDQMIERMQNKVRQYAKRQMTWFKKERNVCWFDISHKNYADKVENLVAKWYDTSTTYAAKD